MQYESIVPEFLIDKYKANIDASNLVNQLLKEANTVIATNSLELFPEYTDHGPNHFRKVLEATRILMPDEVFNALSPMDIACLVCGTILHDLGMFISSESLMILVSESGRPLIPEFDSISWCDLWRDYVNEISQYSEEQRQALYGSFEIITGFPECTDDWTKRHRLCAGEFVRKHHPRIAHEIPLFGIPKFISQFESKKYGDLAGLIGRSHGYQLRDFFEYLDIKFGNHRMPNTVVCIYLMGLLRVADFLDIDSERAPKVLLKNRRFSSKISEKEWALHEIVSNVAFGISDDPEVIEVQAEPDTAEKFLHVKRVLGYLQTELDRTWAVLGEVYGGQTNPVYTSSNGASISLSQYNLKFRRVKSNLSEKKYLETLTFEPVAAKFDTDSASLLDLLIDPLYGKHPEVGVRELMQNAIDATRELEAIDGNSDRTVSVTLECKDGVFSLKVADTGVGMSLGTIQNHFLKIGSSLRRAAEWKKSFAQNGKSNVLRSGRFGIGVLAAFLLGDEIQVQTRHFTEQTGYIFKTTLHQTNIQLDRSPDIPIGTEIRVVLTQERYDVLLKGSANWDWYCDQKPDVKRYVGDAHLPRSKKINPDQLYRCEHEDFDGIFWTYKDSIPRLACNGLVVGAFATQPFAPPLCLDDQVYTDDKTWDYDVVLPHLAISDKNALLPINLSRDKLTDNKLSFSKNLLEEVKNHFIAHCLYLSKKMHTGIDGEISLNNQYPGMVAPKNRGNALVLSNWGKVDSDYLFKDYWHFKSANIARIVVIPPNTTNLVNLPEFGSDTAMFFLNRQPEQPRLEESADGNPIRKPLGDVNFIKRAISGEIFGNIKPCFSEPPITGCRFLLSEKLFEEVQTQSLIPRFKDAAVVKHGTNLVHLEIGTCKGESLISGLAEAENSRFKDRLCVVECSLSGYKTDVPISPFAEAWRDTFESPLLTQNMKLRSDVSEITRNKIEHFLKTDY